ncbi:hypothetical protein R3P38DRAFT_2778646 [Favolaschia claudopus]|uniref:Uncharacterized protein n=1 Tax=Favolaschia claudopus TaxID=2862362 RepID=A0AAW0BHU5_9AGAR
MTSEEEGELWWRGKLSSSDAALALESVKEKSTSSFSTAIRAVTSNAVEIVYEEVRDETTMRARGRLSSRSSRSDAALALETVSNRSELGIQDQRQTGKRDRRRKGNVRLRCPPISTLPPRYPLALADKVSSLNLFSAASQRARVGLIRCTDERSQRTDIRLASCSKPSSGYGPLRAAYSAQLSPPRVVHRTRSRRRKQTMKHDRKDREGGRGCLGKLVKRTGKLNYGFEVCPTRRILRRELANENSKYTPRALSERLGHAARREASALPRPITTSNLAAFNRSPIEPALVSYPNTINIRSNPNVLPISAVLKAEERQGWSVQPVGLYMPPTKHSLKSLSSLEGFQAYTILCPPALAAKKKF